MGMDKQLCSSQFLQLPSVVPAAVPARVTALSHRVALLGGSMGFVSSPNPGLLRGLDTWQHPASYVLVLGGQKSSLGKTRQPKTSLSPLSDAGIAPTHALLLLSFSDRLLHRLKLLSRDLLAAEG